MHQLLKKIQFYLKDEYLVVDDTLHVNGWVVSEENNRVKAVKHLDTVLISEHNVRQVCEFMTKSS